jgi:hypothetical protein
MVALEATSERGRIDIPQLARRLRAVGDARPSDLTGRYTLILRPTDRDPAEALRSAVGEWQEATAALGQDGARLLGARVVQPDTTTQRSRPRRVHIARSTATRVGLVTGALVLVVGALLVVRAVRGPSRPQFAADAHLSARATSPSNLLSNGSFEEPDGAAAGVQGWGSASFEMVSSPVTSGHRAQQVLVAPGSSGGFWIEAAVNAGATYDQSLMLRIDALEPAARVEVGLEWYDDAHKLLDYRMLPVDTAEQRYKEQEQRMIAPPGATSVRFLVNATGGASYLVDDAAIGVAPPDATPPQPPR